MIERLIQRLIDSTFDSAVDSAMIQWQVPEVRYLTLYWRLHFWIFDFAFLDL